MAESNTLSIVCEQCHTKVNIPALAHRQRAVCPVCNHTLISHRDGASEKLLALSFSALIFYFFHCLLISLPLKQVGKNIVSTYLLASQY